MGHLFCAEIVKEMTASNGLSFAKETNTMTLPFARRGALCNRATRRCGNRCATRD
jgi:hypothetical protein